MEKELYDNIPSRLGDLLTNVNNGKIGLPDLQRPFVWADNKVRDLFDSMLRGYPIGYIMLWVSPEDYENTKKIGQTKKIQEHPDELVIDGQQRLTALLAAIYGIKIKDKNYKEKNIRICFNPLTRNVEVWSASYEKDSEWISSINMIFDADRAHNVPGFRREYIKKVNEARNKKNQPEVSEEETNAIEENINALLNLASYSLPTLRINSKANEEDVADIFKRVNSGGQKLTEKNFIETLLAVYDNDVHDIINKFSEKSRIPADGTSYNPILIVSPAHLIRMAVGLGFHRARLQYAYMLMRGKDLATGKYSEAIRAENLKIFKDSLKTVTNLNNWHAFLNLYPEAGYLNSTLVASELAVVFSYVLWLLGKYEYKVPSIVLNKVMKKWIFMATITLFYTGSTETTVEKQFADLRDVKTADEFVAYLDRVINTKLTVDFYNYTLPSALNSSSATSPYWYGYIAALNVLGTPMLFGTTVLAQFLRTGANGTKKAIDKHHIFPKNYLAQIGYSNDRDRNQIANFTYLDYQTNIDISDKPPQEYVSAYRASLGEDGYKLACEQNALPENFETMDYLEFLKERRILMAQIVKKAFEKL